MVIVIQFVIVRLRLKMKLIEVLNKLNLKLNEAVAVYDYNLSSPLFVGFLGDITYEHLRRSLSRIEFEPDKVIYKDNELFFDIKIVLK